jgi:hypothetical protein
MNDVYDMALLSPTNLWIVDNVNLNSDAEHLFKSSVPGLWSNITISQANDGQANGVQFVNFSQGWVVGEAGASTEGAIWTTTNGGQNWTELDLPNKVVFEAVNFVDATHGWAVGEGPLFQIYATTDGVHWVPQSTTGLILSNLLGVSFVDDNNGWVVGSNGTILHTNNGGNSVPQASFTVGCYSGDVCSASYYLVGDEIQANNTSTDGVPPLSYQWNWGDGSSNASFSISGIHSYDNNGTFTITLTVTDANGDDSVAGQSITINPVPLSVTKPSIAGYDVLLLLAAAGLGTLALQRRMRNHQW